MSVVSEVDKVWDGLEAELDSIRSAEEDFLLYAGDEEGANDNFPAHEVLQGCIWRDSASRLQADPGEEEAAAFDTLEDGERRRALDFSDRRRDHRGFLDEEPEESFPYQG